MVIKDLLNKVSSPEDANDPKVAALREKLAALKESKQPQQQTPSKKTASQPSKTASAPKKSSPVDDVEALAQATLEEQKRFAQQEDPELILKEERTQKLLTNQVSELIEVNTELQKRLKKLEQGKQKVDQELEKTQKNNKGIEDKMKLIDQRLEKFMGLYEIITNQYNPFHEELKKKPLPKLDELEQPQGQGKIKLADGLTGEEAEVEFSQGRISSENAQKMAQLLEELEAAERKKQEASDPKPIEKQEAVLAQDAQEGLHEMLEGFEGRLKTYLDKSLQEQLHETFTRLETVLNEEIQQAVKNEIDKLSEHEDSISSALQEIESLQGDGEGFSDTKQEVVHDIKATEDHIKAIPPNLYFRLADGRVLKSKRDLVAALQDLPEDAFSAHVSNAHNHFADWLTLALQDSDGERIRGKSRQEMVELLRTN